MYSNVSTSKRRNFFNIHALQEKCLHFYFLDILRTFNPNLRGYSVGTRFEDGKDWGFNVALGGTRARYELF